jgi:hypothetical protein
VGDLTAVPDRFVNRKMKDDNGIEKPVVEMEFMTEKPVEDVLYKYLTTA